MPSIVETCMLPGRGVMVGVSVMVGVGVIVGVGVRVGVGVAVDVAVGVLLENNHPAPKVAAAGTEAICSEYCQKSKIARHATRPIPAPIPNPIESNM